MAGPDKLVLRGPRLPVAEDGFHTDEFDVAAGEELTFSTTWVALAPARSRDCSPFEDRIRSTIAAEQAWADACEYDGPWRPRWSAAWSTLRGLTHAETGGIVAAPTTSLPEDFGGERNWDYRYCWLRDAALTLEALLAAGALRRGHGCGATGCSRAVAGDPEDLQIMYTVDGGRFIPEIELDPPPRLRRARGRCGSATARLEQRQGDVLARCCRPSTWPAKRGSRRPLTPGPCSGSWSTSSPEQLDQARPRPVGDPRPAAALHAQPGDGLGRVRPGGPRRGEARSRGPRGRVARGSATGCARRCSSRGFDREPRHASPSTTTPPRWTRRC